MSRTRFRGIPLGGNLLDHNTELQKLVPIRESERFLAEKLQAATQGLVDKLGEYGYSFALVNVQPEIDQVHNAVGLMLHVDPGPRMYVRRVIEANTRTRDEVMRREMRQMESSWFNSSWLKLSRSGSIVWDILRTRR